ncbi:MAG: hypothetical protein VB031_09520 [Eubacteriaceae bacterium]|nr:hypothetical protein [Eubacteriaceae bacterium]
MGWNIRVNFGELFEIGRQFYKYGQALNQMESALENAEKLLAENRGLAAKAIMVDTSSMKEKIRKCKKEVSDVQNIIKDYVGDMEEILHPKNENAEMLVDRVDICANIYSMKNVSDQLNFTTMTGAGCGMTGGLSGGGPAADSMVDPGEAAAMAANAEKLSDFLAEAAKTRLRLEDKGRDLDDIYNKVKQFENKDDDYGLRAGQLYDKYSSGGEIAKDQWSAIWNGLKDIGEGVGDMLEDTVVGLCKLVYNIGKAGVSTQAVVICGLTGTKAPDWAYKELEGIDRTAKALLYDPMLAVEGMAQSAKDTYQNKGLAYCVGYVGGDVVMSIMLTRGVSKLGSVGKVGTKLDDVGDVGKIARHGGIPELKYLYYKKIALHNPDSKILTLGSYEGRGPNCYITKAGDTSYFDLGKAYDKIQKKYGLNEDQMFEIFNKPILEDAVREGKTIRFSHDPSKAKKRTALHKEYNYLKSKGYDIKVGKGGFWYAER